VLVQLSDITAKRHERKVRRHLNGVEGGGTFEWWVRSTSALQGKEGGIQVLAGLATSSQTVGSKIRVILNDRNVHSSGNLGAELGQPA